MFFVKLQFFPWIPAWIWIDLTPMNLFFRKKKKKKKLFFWILEHGLLGLNELQTHFHSVFHFLQVIRIHLILIMPWFQELQFLSSSGSRSTWSPELKIFELYHDGCHSNANFELNSNFHIARVLESYFFCEKKNFEKNFGKKSSFFYGTCSCQSQSHWNFQSKKRQEKCLVHLIFSSLNASTRHIFIRLIASLVLPPPPFFYYFPLIRSSFFPKTGSK